MMKNLQKTLNTSCMILATCMVLGGCASKDPIQVNGIEVHDPYEGYNRAIFSFNNTIDDIIIHPIVKGYKAIVPDPVRTGVRNVLRTLRAPVNFANQVLQGDIDGSANVLKRTAINVLLTGGLVDLAGHEGIEYESEDFGQTMAVWGIDHGPYLVLPFLGPSSLRDYAGYAVDSFADPLRIYLNNIDEEGWYYTKVGMDYLTLRASLVDILEELESSSIDYYAATRSTYYQRRQALTEDRSSSVSDYSDNNNAYPDIEDFE